MAPQNPINNYGFQKPWLFGDYETMMNTIDDGDIYQANDIDSIQSQFEKPYNNLSEPQMENAFAPPSQPIRPQNVPWGPGGNDCQPHGSAVGGGALNPCVPQMSCGQWAWTCCHRITKFGVLGNGFLQTVMYQKNDVCVVTACWDESGGSTAPIKGTIIKTKDGGVFQSKVPMNCLGPGHDASCTGSCSTCTGPGHLPDILATSQQMSTGGTQNLATTGGGGGPYTWKIISGGGTLTSKTTGAGQANKYTAPASNANCSNNPTIQVTYYCGNTNTLKLAINNPAETGNAYYVPNAPVSGGPCNWSINRNIYKCDNTLTSTNGCYGCTCGSPPLCTCGGGIPNPCTQTGVIANCNAGAGCAGANTCNTGHKYDTRAGFQISGGCCPAGLL